MDEKLLQVAGLKKFFPIKKGFRRKHVGDVKAVDDVSFDVYDGETLGLVGESGCGKTTTGRTIMRGLNPTGGQVLFRINGAWKDLASIKEGEMRPMRRHLQMIFQDPYASLNPRMTVEQIVKEPLICFHIGSGREQRARVAELLEVVGLNPKRYMERYPHSFSGGQRQRIGIARALALNPDLIIADEPVSALDVSIQAQVINLLQDLQTDFGLTYIFVAHDLGVVEHICDRIAVMYVGKLVEFGRTEDLFYSPKHPYTEALLSAVPRPDPRHRLQSAGVEGEVADPANRPSGCAFHPRCAYAQDICKREEPKMTTGQASEEGRYAHQGACHFADELTLTGVGVD